MAASMSIKRPVGSLFRITKILPFQPVRYRWKPPNKDAVIYPTFSERLTQWKAKYEIPASQGVNIGYELPHYKRDSASRGKSRRERKQELEAAARHRKLLIDVDEMKAEWSKESMPKHVRRLAEHYGIFSDMFDGAYFHPVTPLRVAYDFDEEHVTPVCYGNVIPSSEASSTPDVNFDSQDDSLWTLVMSSPDGNLEDNTRELLHWAVGNIPGNQVSSGDQLCPYLQPFPPRGAGFLRYVFTLYKQESHMDFSDLAESVKSGSLRSRSFSSQEFYRQHEDSLTPAGLAFFQSEWDTCVTSVFHNVLDMKEPTFEFIHPPEYLQAQRHFPHREPFNLYLDMYRDVKDLREEVLKLKLSTVDPTQPPSPPPKYPNADPLPKELPSWQRQRIQHQRLGQFQWRDLHEDRDY